MLKAILHSKAGRIGHSQGESVRWKDLFESREDLLTSTFFERFSYLSDDIQTSILAGWFGKETATSFGPLENAKFWPSYTLKTEDSNNRVEPDLLLEFRSANILVEVKPPEGGRQHLEQWKREVQSYLDTKDSKKPLYFLAIGQIRKSEADTWLPELRREFPELAGARALNWQKVADLLRSYTEGHLVTRTADQRIIDDIFEGLSLYGLRTRSYYWPELVAFTQSKPFCQESLDHPWLQSNPLLASTSQTTDLSFQKLVDHSTRQAPLSLKGMEL